LNENFIENLKKSKMSPVIEENFNENSPKNISSEISINDLIKNDDFRGVRDYIKIPNYKPYMLILACKMGALETTKHLLTNYCIDLETNHDYIIFASKKGHLDIVEYLVIKGANISGNNNRPLEYACKKGHLNIVTYLISRGAIPTTMIFRTACQYGWLEIVKYLDQVNHPDKYISDIFSFELACTSGNLELVRYLTEYCHYLNIPNCGEYALSRAGIMGHTHIVKYLLKKGVNITVEAVQNAISSDRLNVVKIYTKRMNISDYEYYALNVASRSNAMSCLEYLIGHFKCDFHTFFKEALYDACWMGYLSIVKYLVKTYITRYSDLTKEIIEKAIDSAENGGDTNSNKIIKFLKKQEKFIGENSEKENIAESPEKKSRENSEKENPPPEILPMDIACKNGWFGVIKLLISLGCLCEVNSAIENDQENVIEYLVSQGIDITANENDALKYAVKYNKIKMANFLLIKYGKEINDKEIEIEKLRENLQL
jgi:ankyrin repeat protein